MRVGRSTRWLGALVVVAALALVGAACGGDDGEDDGGGGTENGGLTEVLVMTPGDSDSFTYPPNVLGQARFYEEEGLDVTFEGGQGASFVVQQMIAGRADYGIVTSNALIIGASQGADVRGIAQLDTGIFTIVVPGDSDVEGIEDLEGGSIGITEQGAAQTGFTAAVLENAGIDPRGDVETPVVGDAGPAVYEAIESGRIDAFSGTINDVASLQGAAPELELRNIVPDEYQELPISEFAVTPSVLEEEEARDIAVRLARAWRNAIEFGLENPEESLDLGCDLYPQQCENRDAAESVWNTALENAQWEDQFGLHNYAGLERVQSELISEDELEGTTDVEAVFTDELVDEINE